LLNFLSCSNKEKQPTPKKFKENDNIKVFTTKFILTDKKDITQVFHEVRNAGWYFYSDDFFDDGEAWRKTITLREIIYLDSSVIEIADLEKGYGAHRRFKGDKWVIEKIK